MFRASLTVTVWAELAQMRLYDCSTHCASYYTARLCIDTLCVSMPNLIQGVQRRRP
jgi:hypothetical protein